MRRMKIESLRVGQSVRHPQYGAGIVKAVNEHAAEIQFNDQRRTVHPETSGLEPSEPQAAVSGLSVPLEQLIRDTVEAAVNRLGLEKPGSAVAELGPRWRGGKLMLHPADTTLAPKEVELEQFFHKLVMMRNNLRVLEQKINASETLTSAEKFDWQQYLTRCYGSMTTFNLLFREKEGGF